VADGDLTWSVQRRLTFVETRLFWLGQVSRGDIVERFDVSLSQASADIARYVSLNPEGVDYDRSAKRYVTRDGFRPVFAAPSAQGLLGELRLVEEGLLPADQTVTGSVPPFDATPVPERAIDATVLREVLRAIRQGRALDCFYQSMSRPQRTPRTIEPHAIAYDGFRWHTRAFDRDSGEFRDFVLGRLSRPKLAGPAGSTMAADTDWNSVVELNIAPHPGLTPAQAKAVALDYGMTRGSVRLKVRRALLYYALKRLGLDHAPETRPPNVQQIVLINRDAVQPLVQGR
jgi:predicted DNA-binding transcriptional regulator YafY